MERSFFTYRSPQEAPSTGREEQEGTAPVQGKEEGMFPPYRINRLAQNMYPCIVKESYSKRSELHRQQDFYAFS